MGPGQGKPWDGGDTKRAEPPPERTGIDATAARPPGIPFPAVAEAILYRWAVERDTAVSAGEIDQVRAYLKRRGVRAMPLPDGRFTMDGAMTGTVERAGLVLAALRAFVQAQVVARGR
jgi:hypothetical protein